MKSIWSGHITFGLISIPVGLYSAIESSERVSFRLLHRKDMAPIRYKKFCSVEDVEVGNDEIVKGYEVSKKKYAVVEEEELDEVQEEVGDFGGARTTVFALDPQVALAIDVTGATDVPEGDPKLDGEAKLGAGPIINRGSTISPKVFELLVAAAEDEGIAYTVNVSAGDTYTDMDAAYASRGGVATGLISLAIRYLHTPGEVVSLDDVEAAIRLVAAFARRLEPGLDFTR